MQRPWSGYCEAFVEIAYGTRHHFASATANYRAQAAAGRIHTDANPPVGALVFYSGGQYGHVALSVGGGQVITTWGHAGDRYDLRLTGVHSLSNPYLGWSYPPDNWPK
jgi:cell wall-associated NlpC family hydrolase